MYFELWQTRRCHNWSGFERGTFKLKSAGWMKKNAAVFFTYFMAKAHNYAINVHPIS